jgi:hypothetical protein
LREGVEFVESGAEDLGLLVGGRGGEGVGMGTYDEDTHAEKAT